MKIIFTLSDGRTFEGASENFSLSCPEPYWFPVAVPVLNPDGTLQVVSMAQVRSVQVTEEPADKSVKWCEELYKLEDRRDPRKQ